MNATTVAAVTANGKYSLISTAPTNDAAPKTRRKSFSDRIRNGRMGKIKNTLIDLLVYSDGDPKNKANIALSANVQKFTSSRYLYRTNRGFANALELFNRSRCFQRNHVWVSKGPFFECKGAVRVRQRLCSRCHDLYKISTKTDMYYIDLTERLRNRTILCHGCLGFILREQVGCNDEDIKQQLQTLKTKQSNGVAITGDLYQL